MIDTDTVLHGGRGDSLRVLPSRMPPTQGQALATTPLPFDTPFEGRATQGERLAAPAGWEWQLAGCPMWRRVLTC